MNSVPDRQLSEPFRSWIDGRQPLPKGVRLFPRAVRVVHDVLYFVLSVVMFLGLAFLVHGLFWEDLVRADARWEPILSTGAAFLLLALIPLFSLRRMCITIATERDRRRGVMRQGILVGPEGILVRMEPNDCYPVPLDRFLSAAVVHRPSGQESSLSRFVIETLDGPVDYYYKRLPDPWKSAETLTRCVEKLRKPRREPNGRTKG